MVGPGLAGQGKAWQGFQITLLAEREIMIKAIETVYNGYRFRSRLEARWAVFFDALGVKYEYEKEGFDLDGVWYLPDFWLPQVSMWAEVKGGAFTWEEMHKCALLQKGTGYPCLMLEGMPDYRSYFETPGEGWFSTMDGSSVVFSNGDSGLPGGDYEPVLRYCDNDEFGGDVEDYILGDRYLCESRFYRSTGAGYPEPCKEKEFIASFCEAGIIAARQARFEHGETPKVGGSNVR